MPKKLSQFLKSRISGMLEAILLKFGKWNPDVDGRVNNCSASYRQPGATNTYKLIYGLKYKCYTYS